MEPTTSLSEALHKSLPKNRVQNPLWKNFLTRSGRALCRADQSDGQKVSVAHGTSCRAPEPGPRGAVPMKHDLAGNGIRIPHDPAIIGLHAAYRVEIDRRNGRDWCKANPVSSRRPRPTHEQRRAP